MYFHNIITNFFLKINIKLHLPVFVRKNRTKNISSDYSGFRHIPTRLHK